MDRVRAIEMGLRAVVVGWVWVGVVNVGKGRRIIFVLFFTGGDFCFSK